jgi:hypothetical protein
MDCMILHVLHDICLYGTLGFRLSFITTEWKSVTGLARDPPLAAYGVVRALSSGCQLV